MNRFPLWALALALGGTGAWADAYKDCQAKDPDRSIRGCTQVIKRGKYESRIMVARACGFRGIAYSMKGERDRAIAEFTKSITLEPNNAVAYGMRGSLYADNKEFVSAIADFNMVIALAPDDSDGYVARGLAYAGKNEFDLAIADFRRALEINPSDQNTKELLKKLGVTP